MKNLKKKVCAESIKMKLTHLLSKIRTIIRRNVFFTGTWINSAGIDQIRGPRSKHVGIKTMVSRNMCANDLWNDCGYERTSAETTKDRSSGNPREDMVWFKKENFRSLTPYLPPRGPGPMSAACASSLPLVTITLLVSALDEELEKQRDSKDF